MINRFFNRFTPDSIKKNSLFYSRAKNILGAAIITIIAVPFYASIYFILNDPLAAAIILFEGLVIASTIILFKYTGSIFLVRELIVGSLSVCLIWLSYHLGGITSPVTFWLILPPLAALFFGGNKTGAFSGFICMTAVIILYSLEYLHIPFPISPISNILLLQTISIIGLMIIFLCLGYFFERGKIESLQENYKINKDLRIAKEIAENLRTKAEQANLEKLTAISQSENKFKSILEGAPDAMVISNQNGIIVMVNSQTENIFGYTKSEIIGQHVEFLMPKRYRHHHVNHRNGYFSNPHPRPMGADLELYGLHKNTTEFPVEISLSPVETTEGTLALAAIRDITNKKQIAQILIDKNIQLENANLAKDQFLSHMSHELRTPLNGIITMTQLLSTSNLSKEQKDQLNIISESEEQLLFVINQILDFSKVKSGIIEIEKVVFNIRELIKKILAVYEIKAKIKNVQLTFYIDDAISEYYIGDQIKIRQALSNILDNAVKFTDSGRIDVTISLHRKNNDMSVLLFEVTDTGIGITPEIHSRLFESFSQGDSSMSRKYGGTGLGLVISKSLIEAMNGSIDVEATDHGSRFYFTVPMIESKKLPHDKEKSPSGTTASIEAKKPKETNIQISNILLAEDNTLNQKTLKMILENFGHKVTIVSDGIEALDALNKFPYDLILMDCQMPNMDGYATTRLIRKKEQGSNIHIPIIGVTAHVMECDRDKCLDAGMDEYLPKPFNIYELHNLIRTYTKG